MPHRCSLARYVLSQYAHLVLLQDFVLIQQHETRRLASDLDAAHVGFKFSFRCRVEGLQAYHPR